jgi:hypothetical protein
MDKDRWIFAKIVGFLDYKSCYNLMKTCKQFYSEDLWEFVCKELFADQLSHKTDPEKWSSFFLLASFSLGEPTHIDLHQEEDVGIKYVGIKKTTKMWSYGDVDIKKTTKIWSYGKDKIRHRGLDLPAEITTTIERYKEVWYWHGSLYRKNGGYTQRNKYFINGALSEETQYWLTDNYFNIEYKMIIAYVRNCETVFRYFRYKGEVMWLKMMNRKWLSQN